MHFGLSLRSPNYLGNFLSAPPSTSLYAVLHFSIGLFWAVGVLHHLWCSASGALEHCHRALVPLKAHHCTSVVGRNNPSVSERLAYRVLRLQHDPRNLILRTEVGLHVVVHTSRNWFPPCSCLALLLQVTGSSAPRNSLMRCPFLLGVSPRVNAFECPSGGSSAALGWH